MTQIKDTTECADCGNLVDCSKENPHERIPCSNCGSTLRNHTVTIIEDIRAIDGYGVIGKRPSKKKPFVEEISKPNYSCNREKLVHKQRVIDRDNNKYFHSCPK